MNDGELVDPLANKRTVKLVGKPCAASVTNNRAVLDGLVEIDLGESDSLCSPENCLPYQILRLNELLQRGGKDLILSPDAKMIWGAQVSEDMDKTLRVMLIITGVKSNQIIGTRASKPESESTIDNELGIEFYS